MKKKRTRLIIYILIGLGLLFLVLKYTGCIGGAGPMKVALTKVVYDDIVQTVDASGKIYPENEVKIKADVSGEIVELPIEEGDSVTKGQLLAKIDPVIYQTQVTQAEALAQQANAGLSNAKEMAKQAKAQFDKAKSDYERNQQLFQEQVISKSEFEQFQSEYLSAKAAYDAAQANISSSQFGEKNAQAGLSQSKESLNRTIIKAPTSGTISQLLVKNGERVVGTQQMDGSQLMTIADLGRMEVRVEVSETDISKVSIGDTANINVDAYPDRQFKGVVSKIGVSSVELNNVAGTASTLNNDQVTNYTVHILILPAEQMEANGQKVKSIFKPGMSAGVEILTRKVSHVIAVPINAVTTRAATDTADQSKVNDNQLVVFVYDAKTHKVAARTVTTGIQDNNHIQILSGLKEGEQIVNAPYSAIARDLENGTEVEAVAEEQLYQGETSE